jgi:hypothetical protein
MDVLSFMTQFIPCHSFNFNLFTSVAWLLALAYELAQRHLGVFAILLVIPTMAQSR